MYLTHSNFCGTYVYFTSQQLALNFAFHSHERMNPCWLPSKEKVFVKYVPKSKVVGRIHENEVPLKSERVQCVVCLLLVLHIWMCMLSERISSHYSCHGNCYLNNIA